MNLSLLNLPGRSASLWHPAAAGSSSHAGLFALSATRIHSLTPSACQNRFFFHSSSQRNQHLCVRLKCLGAGACSSSKCECDVCAVRSFSWSRRLVCSKIVEIIVESNIVIPLHTEKYALSCYITAILWIVGYKNAPFPDLSSLSRLIAGLQAPKYWSSCRKSIALLKSEKPIEQLETIICPLVWEWIYCECVSSSRSPWHH